MNGGDAAVLIGFASLVVSIILPIVLRIIDLFRHWYRRWRQTVNIKKIVRRGVDCILNDNPPVPKSTAPGRVGEDTGRPSGDAGRYAYFDRMIFDLNVVLDYYSSDIGYQKKRDIRHICIVVNNAVRKWREVCNGKYPPKDVYENFIIKQIAAHKWLGI